MTSHKTSTELERDIEEQRAHLSRTLDRISARMTPGQVVDEAWEFARNSGGGDFVRNLGTSVRDNPLPVGLVTAGIAWLMSGRSGSLPRVPRRSSSRPRDRVLNTEPLDTSYDGFAGSGRPDGNADQPGFVSQAAGAVASGASSVRERVGRTAEMAGDAARIAMEDTRETLGDLTRSTGETLRQFRSGAGEHGGRLRARAESFAEEQPLLLAVAGLAIGALVGAMTRSTSAEARLMGEASDRLKDRARDAAASGVESAAGIVDRTYEAVRSEAEREGLTGDAAREAADGLTQKVRNVAQKGKEQLEEELDAASGAPAGAH